MREPEFISREGIPILYVDFSSMKTKEEVLNLISLAKKSISIRPPKSIFTLTNLSNMYFNTEVYTAISDYARMNEPYVKASAVVGLSGLMMIFYNGFLKLSKRDVRAFSTEEEAVNYLLEYSRSESLSKKQESEKLLIK
jgi:hypothetical protein